MAGKCDACKFYSPAGNCGVCRLNPPTVVVQGNDINTAYPSIRPDDWCGKFDQDLSKAASEPRKLGEQKQDMDYKLGK